MKFKGKVFKGKGEGTKLGFPTANIKVATNIEPGIYVGYANLNKDALKKRMALFYISGNDNNVVECYILDFPKKDLYGFEISVEILHKLRDIQQFSDLQEARGQIKKDEIEAREWFNKQE